MCIRDSIAAIHGVCRAEFAEQLSALAELSKDRAVEFHLVDLTAGGHLRGIVAFRARVRAVEVLMRAWRDADGPRRSDTRDALHEIQIIVVHLDPIVAAIGDVHIPFCIRLDGVWRVELARAVSE